MGKEARESRNSESIVVFIRADTIGRGDEELGSNLMFNFIYHLRKADLIPDAIVLMNAGVKLVVEDSEVLDDMKELESKGAEILACGTCLRFFDLEGRQKVGAKSNMSQITNALMNASRIITV
jgi:selenium metabolism protein YedF